MGIIKPPIPAEGAGRPPFNGKRCKASVGALFVHPSGSNHNRKFSTGRHLRFRTLISFSALTLRAGLAFIAGHFTFGKYISLRRMIHKR